MLTKNFHQLQAEVSAHVAADQVAQGSYKTCFIGCLAGGKDLPEFLQSEYGIPLAVSRIAKSIFEGLPPDEAAAFFAALPAAIECNGKDLSRVVWQFLAAELRSLPPVEPEVQAATNLAIKGMDLLAQDKEWPEGDASAVARAAAWAAYYAAWAGDSAAARASASTASAARAAGWAADCAGWAADCDAQPRTARRRQRDLLLKLIKEAPVTTTQEDN